MEPGEELKELARQVRRHLARTLQAGGWTAFSPPKGASPLSAGSGPLSPELPSLGLTPGQTPLPTLGEKEALLAPMREQALGCIRCRLHETRTKVVFGEGSAEAPILFVGEGPGRDEDLQGRPFVGAAGKLLTRIIEAMGFRRQEVYICNVVKCRPPNNRPPAPDEAEACRGYLTAQLTTIRPQLICALGRTAANALLETQAPMSALRGKILAWGEIPLIVTFHPAYLLRNPAAKKEVWDDMKRALAFLGRTPPPRRPALRR